MRIVAIIQARMGSTRLPGKVLQELGGAPMLARVVNRSARTKRLDELVVATTLQAADEPIVKSCAAYGWPCFRGSAIDVLDRSYQAAIEYRADVVVRITADCPLIEPEIVDLVVQEFCVKGPLDYVSNTLSPRSFPRGLDVEVMTFEALACAWLEDENPLWREHVTPYIYRHPEKFTLKAVANEKNYSSMRWTVDTAQDLAFVRQIYNYFGHDRFSWKEVLAVLEEHPEWLEINRHVKQKVI